MYECLVKYDANHILQDLKVTALICLFRLTKPKFCNFLSQLKLHPPNVQKNLDTNNDTC